MIKNIIFDIGNVLARFRWQDYIKERFTQKVQKRIEMATVHGPYWDEVDRGALPMEEIVRRCVALEPELAEEIEAFFVHREELVEEYAYSADLIRALKKQGYGVYLLSNYSGDMFAYAKTIFRFLKYVDGGVISYEIQHIKPEPEIYETLLKKYDLKAEECVFLDDLERNLKGAERFGLHTIQFEGYLQAIRQLASFGVEVNMIQALIFDVDGTLWDTTEAAAKIWSDVAGRYPEVKDEVTAEKLRSLYGLPLEDIAVKLFPSVSEKVAIEIMEECVRVQCPILEKGVASLLGPVKETFAKLAEKYRIFIVSNCRSGYIEALIKAHELAEYVTDFTCPGETGLLKADNIRLICERNHISLASAVYIGDTRADEIASREAGIPFIFAAYGFGEVQQPDGEINSIADLPALLEKL